METVPKKTTDDKKYERQLRLWGEQGQANLENARVCLINATAVGTETLKNLVLPGIGYFTIVDGNKVDASDFNNFFILEGTLGKSRGSVAAEHLNELNSLVTGDHVERSAVDLINNEPNFFKKFTVVIANDLADEPLLKLSKLCYDNHIVLVVTNVYGFLGYIRLVSPEHTIILSKPDNPADDLRLANPFPELSKFADSVDMSTLNSQEHSHVPFLVILLQLVKKWKDQHGGKLPETSSDKSAFKSEILKGSKGPSESNFPEAYKAHFKATTPTKIPSAVQAILNDPKATNITAQSSDFWIITAAVREFVQHEGAGLLPLMGSIPDMTATTTGYITLQKKFFRKRQIKM